jgi:cytoskeletal protein CcmA (bactofilin family)
MARVSIFPAGTTVDGDVDCDEDVIVEGRVNGTVLVTGVLLVETTGAIRGDVRGGRVVVRGIVLGSVEATDGIIVEDGARVVGDLYAPRVHLEDGALFRGRVEIAGEGAWDVTDRGSVRVGEEEDVPPPRASEPAPPTREGRPRRTRNDGNTLQAEPVLGREPRRRRQSDGPPEMRIPVVGRAVAHRRAHS